ncbi:MmcQ/YjbR family DNA-binding protein [Sinomicrobium weinanense]|uniref:MmcQ/YjbR family DNA-binding protein n=1 Tax=Sinomicrobium weinanense TaxID=2842200 RepID=A0A926Q0N1_9FLAO|nr:MmcQ/YjbR family DNA-binding protein [Sinomicrobium weinanense]MBC9794948.1 MmcQ/YjbR family DNA-binding protein [Sinomicrobium weinanense]MBU3125191.1 MmcQ/YjbR family DNA-binding protein [Sinomicrobium weinanense]
MNIEDLRNYCLNKKGATEDAPFGEDTIVFKVMGKMFALTSLNKWEAGDHSVNLKCDPERIAELRAEYESIQPGYHMNKRHWNTVDIDNGELPPRFVEELIDHSYDLVVRGLTKKQRENLASL